MSDVYDAVIVGSGAGGGAAAWKLTQAGMRVCVLERGPEYQSSDYIHDELSICRRNFWTPDPARDPHVIARPGKPVEQTAEGWIATCVGGGTVHMGGYYFRMQADDFQQRTRIGQLENASLADWPFGLAELEPHYDEAERVLGLSGEGPLPEGRRLPFPNGPLLAHPSAALIDKACRKLGMTAFTTPRALLSSDYQDRSACRYCGYCGSYGCEVGAKSSAQATFLAQAQRTGKLTLRADTTAISISLNPRGEAQGVIVRETHPKKPGVRVKEIEVRGRAILLACSAIETARLLLGCQSAAHPQGLANGSGLVGKNLQFAAFAGGRGQFPYRSESFPESADRLPFIDRSCQDFYRRPELPTRRAGTLLFQRAHFNPIYLAERIAAQAGSPPLFGAALQQRLREAFLETRTLEWEGFSEFIPHAGCEVSLDPVIQDPHGRASARLQISVHPASRAASEFLAAKGRAVLETAGARGLVRNEEDIYPVLQAGTARMGTHPRDSVLAPDGQAHEVPRLYIADSSGFPSTGGAPFTLTIHANALRVAAGIAARAKRREL